MSQIELHRNIFKFVQGKPERARPEDLKSLVSRNKDAYQYFFFEADERWLVWLWKNGFLDVIKKKAEDPTRYGYRTPELNYLVRMAEKNPDQVVTILLKVPVKKSNFNPEVIDQFLRICSTLPANQLAKIANKILEEKWVPLMGLFNQHGFEFEKMFKTFAEDKDFDNLLTLAEAVLSVRTKKEIKETSGRSITENPFYFNGLSYTKVFQYLGNTDTSHIEKVFALVTSVFADVIKVLGKAPDRKERSAFKVYDSFILSDVDFFELEQRNKVSISPREDIRELAATIKLFTDKLIGDNCNQPQKVCKTYKQYIGTLPDSQAVWRLKLYILSLCPDAFKTELKAALFAIFDNPNYTDLTMGAEYGTALQKNFGILARSEQQEYIEKAKSLFSDKSGEKKEVENRIYRGSRIFSLLEKHLSKTEHEEIKKAGFQVKPEYKPSPIVGPVTGGTVAPRGPLTQEEFDALPVKEIAEKLQTVWSPKVLDKQNTHKDFLHPLNAEGAGDLLKTSISKRLTDFVSKSDLFFDSDKLDPHYTYAFLRGIESEIKNNKEVASNINWGNLVALLVSIKNSGKSKQFARTRQREERYSSWLADWNAVHSMVATLIEELLREFDGKAVLDLSKYREEILSVIDYLFRHQDPAPKDEQPKTATMTRTSPGQKPLVTEPYMMAINSVRGKTFEAFIHFVYQDGKSSDNVQISADVKDVYMKVLNAENTKAIMFMFGRYLATFYYRDAKWIHGLLPKIFPIADSKKLLYVAAWEGYISNNLFKELFGDPEFQKLYTRGLSLRRSMDSTREFFKDPEEGIATHLALAYAHYSDFGFGHPLFKTFWSKGTEKHHSEFIGFIGRKYLSKNESEGAINHETEIKQRLDKLWDWILDNYKHTKSLTEFGYWTRSEPQVFELSWLADHIKRTLEVTGGELDWDYGLQKNVVNLAESSPKDTLDILRWSLLEFGVRKEAKRRPIFFETEWYEAFAILYKNQGEDIRNSTYELIDDLIREGGSQFWPLKKIIES
ncbi:hypothetical protein KY385_04655 [Candidatus Parcubacteria bacterium]|nr:hypothetical protein [Candidatus Parcubacteria bacterium]